MAIRSPNLQPLTNSYLDGILSGAKWALDSSRTLTFQLSNYQSFYSVNENSYIPNASGLSFALEIMATDLERYLNLDIQILPGVLPDPAYSGADITISPIWMASRDATFLGLNANVLGVAEFPDANTSGDVYQWNPKVDLLMNEIQLASSILVPGASGTYTLYHELGHALGLKHPHDGGQFGRPTFNSLGIGQYDLGVITTMSYEDPSQYSFDGYGAPSTFMVGDIFALQTLYGKNTTFNLGNHFYDVSGFSSAYQDVWGSIYDCGGVDTVSAASANKAWYFYLSEGLCTSSDSRSGMWLLSHKSSADSSIFGRETCCECVIGSSYHDRE